MLTRMTEEDWAIVVLVFDAARSRRGEPGHDDRNFPEAIHYFTVHNITWRALPAEFGKWNSVWKRFWRLSRTGVFEAFFSCWRSKARRRIWYSSSTALSSARMSRRPAQNGATKSGARPLTRRILDKNPSQDRSRRQSARFPSDRRRSERRYAV